MNRYLAQAEEANVLTAFLLVMIYTWCKLDTWRLSGPQEITVGFGSMWLRPRINEFINEYPEINLKLNYSEDEQDMLRQNYDIGIWMRRNY